MICKCLSLMVQQESSSCKSEIVGLLQAPENTSVVNLPQFMSSAHCTSVSARISWLEAFVGSCSPFFGPALLIDGKTCRGEL